MKPDDQTTMIGVVTSVLVVVAQLALEGKLKPEFLIIALGIAVLGWKSRGTDA